MDDYKKKDDESQEDIIAEGGENGPSELADTGEVGYTPEERSDMEEEGMDTSEITPDQRRADIRESVEPGDPTLEEDFDEEDEREADDVGIKE